MSVTFTHETPKQLVEFESPEGHDPVEEALKPEQLQQIAEIFNTPLTGAYTWDYRVQDSRIRKLYRLGKQLNWDPETDINWNQDVEPTLIHDVEKENFEGWHHWDDMTEKEQDAFRRHSNAWTLSQFLHGEQGALLVASQLVSCAPTLEAKLYAGSQTFDEARHVEVFNKYIQERVGLMYPISDSLKSIIDKILTDPRWDLKFIGMQIIIEGLALSAFATLKQISPDPVLRDLITLVLRDEARHVTFGVNYLEEFVKTLSEEEIEERAEFAYEACVISRERLIASDVHAYFGWPTEEARKRVLDGEVMQLFRNLLFQRVIPNLKRIGLLTESIRPKFEALGILEYENLAHDGDIDWVELGKPLFAAQETQTEVLEDS